MRSLISVGTRIEIESLVLFMHQSLIYFVYDNQIVGVYDRKMSFKNKKI